LKGALHWQPEWTALDKERQTFSAVKANFTNRKQIDPALHLV